MARWGKGPVESEQGDLFTARIVGMNREIYRLGLEEREETLRGELSGRLRFASEEGKLPVVGDWVRCVPQGDFALIQELLPRRTLISRKIAGQVTEEQPLAANMDVVGIVQGLDGGRNFSLRGLERYLTLAWNSGAQPLVILNKADLCNEEEGFRSEAEFAAPGVDVIITSAAEGRGIEELSRYLAGKTALLIGPSGVGKSALSNGLTGGDFQKTGANRAGDRKGRHTTTSSRLFILPAGGWLIDSPGLKEIQLWGEQEGVEETFPEIEELSRFCRFRDCLHEGEPGCAVQEALREGRLDRDRYLSYLELRKELAWLDSRKNEKGRLDQKKRNKELSKYVKNLKKGKSVY
ncbi:MAG: ribosome small subunit-dependent GTPase A [Spirochaetales bacterium]|nr:ribosome small subunit-dependent GTPase A [Spirochaetales bacterium]